MQKGFIRNTAVLFAAMFISKALGAVLKIPLGNILGGEGMGYFTTAYSLFTPVLSFVCAGIPTILTRNVAAYAAEGDHGKVRKTRQCSLLLAAIVGIAGTALICIAAVPFVCYIANSPESLPGVLLIAPSALFCSITAVYRGYYEGLSDMLPTALSQVIEAFVKALLGVGLSYYVYSNGVRLFGSQQASLPYAAAAAILGVTISEFAGMLFILIRSRNKSDSFRGHGGKMTSDEMFRICRGIVVKALPVSLGATAANLIALADMFTISNCIDLSVNLFPDKWAGDPVVMSGVHSVGNFMYGCYAGIIMSVYMLITAVSGVVGRCAMPRLAAAAGRTDEAAISREIRLTIKGTAVLTAPLTVFTAVLAEPILKLLYPVRETEVAVSVLPLAVLGAGGLAAGLLGAVCTVFLAYGDFGTPIRITLIGGALKLMFNVLFITLPSVNITGAAISAVLSNIICLIFAVRSAKKRLGAQIPYIRYALPSAFAAAGGGIGIYLFRGGLTGVIGDPGSMFVSALLGGIMYALMLYIADSSDCSAALKMLTSRRKA
ncbi:MAG: oligosaccharide flippase family protein [Ruminiclostridium sp.]|nr:oligosaccharide flippase family protein [Ruminiclostridium sp.]